MYGMLDGPHFEYLNKGQDLALLMHSYSGVVGTNARAKLHKARDLDGWRSGRVTAWIYMTAFVPFENQSLAAIFGRQLPPWLTSNPDTKNVDIDDRQWHFYSDLPKEQQDQWSRALVRHPVVCQYEPVQYWKLKDELGGRFAWRDVERIVYLFCEKDEVLPASVQRMMIDRLETEGGLG